MAYNIKKYNGSALTVVADGTLDSTLSLKLVGKNYAGYGEAQNENFVYLLENFAKTTAPTNPINGQLWFDTSSNRIKLFDSNSRWRVTGGADISPTKPSWLPEGEFWFDSVNRQLWIRSLNLSGSNTSGYVLVGPQAVGNTTVTEMFSTLVNDDAGNSHAVIEAIVNGQVTFIISSDPVFTLDNSSNLIEGFTKVYPGVTLHNTSAIDQTTSDATTRFFGTASNSDKLSGYLPSHFAPVDTPAFTGVSNFSNSGFTIGSTPTLQVVNIGLNNTTSVIKNTVSGGTIELRTSLATPLIINGSNLLPGATATTDLGSSTYAFKDVYASSIISSSIGLSTGTTTINNSLTVAGDLIVNGNTTTVNTTTLSIADPLIYLANGNAANLVDIGFVGRYDTAAPVATNYTGLVRDANDGVWKLFTGTATPSTIVDFTNATYSALRIGALTAAGGSFTALTATGAITHATTTNSQSYTTSTGVISISSGTTGSINNMTIGSTSAVGGSFSTLTYSTSATGITVTPNSDSTTKLATTEFVHNAIGDIVIPAALTETAPITITGGAIGITAASTSAAGSMSKEDKSKLNSWGTMTKGTGVPSGGVDGDVHFRYIA